MSLKTHLIFSISAILSLLVPIGYSIVLYSYSKSLQTAPLLWAALGLVKGPLAIVFFALMILYKNKEVDISILKSKFIQIIIWLFILVLIGIIINLFNKSLLPVVIGRLFSVEQFAQYNLFLRIDVFSRLICISVLNIAIAIWLYFETEKTKEFPVLWVLLALFSGLLSPILFITYIFIKHKFESETSILT